MGAFLSICIPTYNRAEVVYKTVRNILNYNGNNIEIVVSNNCSSDNTEELLLEIKDKRVKYFKNNSTCAVGFFNNKGNFRHTDLKVCLQIL